MNDQAAKLRSLMNRDIPQSEPTVLKRAEVICVSSGKGGVGKSNITLNLSIAIRQMGKSVCIIDADIGLSNIEIIAGVDTPYSFSDVIEGKRRVGEVITHISEDVHLVSGGAGITALNNLANESGIAFIIGEIQKLQDFYDYILIDTGAGISPQVIDFIRLSDTLIVISTPDPTSVMDAYVLVKAANGAGYRGRILYVANMVKSSREGELVYEKIADAGKNFISVEIEKLGYIPRSDDVVKSIRMQTPFIIMNKRSEASRRVVEMADFLVTHEKKESRKKLSDRIFSLFLS